MLSRIFKINVWLSFLLGCVLVLNGRPASASMTSALAPTSAPQGAVEPSSEPVIPATSSVQENPPSRPPPTPLAIHYDRDAQIGKIVGNILEQNHYLRTPVTPEISQRWLKNYLLALDPLHVFFVKSDIDEFTAKYGNELGDKLLHNDHISDDAAVGPAFDIFNRFLTRLKEKIALVKLNVGQKYDFTVNDVYKFPSDKSNWSSNLTTSAEQWRQQVKADLLQSLLDQVEKTRKNKGINMTLPLTPDELAVTPGMVKKVLDRYQNVLYDREDWDETDVLHNYLDALSHAYDPHTDYFPPADAESFKISSLDLAVTGIGAELQQIDGYATIENIIPGGPADLDHRLQKNDRIAAVGQGMDEPVDTLFMRLNKVVDMIRGKSGTLVRLIIIPAGATDTSVHKEIVLKRDKVKLKRSFANADIIVHPLSDGQVEKIGVINLHQFYNSTALDIGKLIVRLKEIEKVNGIILDMRNNGGGLLDQAIDLSGLFVRHEPVVQTKDSAGNLSVLREDTREIWNGPLAVMVNKASASATEIVAGALQDYGRALIVGDQSTHGKGTVQTMAELKGYSSFLVADPGELKMTIAKFYRVSGGSTQEKGVVPDVILPSPLDPLPWGEKTLPYHLPYDTINAVPFDYYNLVAPYLPVLQKASSLRVNASPDFAFMREQNDILTKKLQDSTASLNINSRLQEYEDTKARKAKSDALTEAWAANHDKVYELTLDMVDQNLPVKLLAVAKPKPLSNDLDDEDRSFDPEATSVSYDPQLSETVNILIDYMHQLNLSGTKMTENSH